MSSLKLLRGVRALLTDTVEHGSRAVETIQLEAARRPFSVLEAIPPLAVPARAVHVVHDAVVTMTHASIRGGRRAIFLFRMARHVASPALTRRDEAKAH